MTEDQTGYVCVSFMELSKAVEELRVINKQLERLNRLKALRKILRIILIGFVLGKDIDKRLGELTARRNSVLGELNGHCTHTSEAISKQGKDIVNSGI